MGTKIVAAGWGSENRVHAFPADRLPEMADEFRQAIAKDGIAVIKGALGPKDIADLRAKVDRHLSSSGRRLSLGKTQPNAALTVPELSSIFHDSRIASVIKTLLANRGVVFTGHCDIHRNMLSGWHKDSGENVAGGYFKGDYFGSDECQVYKVAIYLQDTGPRDSFSAHIGSHRTPELHTGPVSQVKSNIGDLVVFDVRLSHCGQLPDPVEKGLKGLSLLMNGMSRDAQDPKAITSLKDLYWKLIGRRHRLSVFFTYGADNSFTHDFAAENMARQERQGAGSSDTFPGGLAEGLAQQDIMISEIL